MRATIIATGGLVLALLAAPAFAQDDDWVRVPSSPSQGAASGSGDAANAPAGGNGSPACAMAAAFVEETAKLRDKGVTKQSQLDSIDNPNGKPSGLAGGKPFADIGDALRAGLHSEVEYVYQHREMTPAALGAQARKSCGVPGRGTGGTIKPPSGPPPRPS